jgi:hypothetical protein
MREMNKGEKWNLEELNLILLILARAKFVWDESCWDHALSLDIRQRSKPPNGPMNETRIRGESTLNYSFFINCVGKFDNNGKVKNIYGEEKRTGL